MDNTYKKETDKQKNNAVIETDISHDFTSWLFYRLDYNHDDKVRDTMWCFLKIINADYHQLSAMCWG
jgi:hypothetical protein